MSDTNLAPTVRGGQPQIRQSRRINFWLTGFTVALSLVQLFVLPLWLLPMDAAWGWVLVSLVLMTTPFWSLVHDAIHGTLFADRARNDRWGRVLATLYGAPFALLKAGHLLHHRYSRTRRERSEIYDPERTAWARVAPGYYLRLFGGLYLLEVASVLLAALPARTLARLARRIDSPDTLGGLVLERVAGTRMIRQFRLDAAAVVLVHVAAFVVYWAHFWMLALAIVGRALVVSLADNSYHYGTKLDAPLEAMNLRLARPLERFALNFNLHEVHHRHPGLPWFELRDAFIAEEARYHLGWFAAVGRQLRGPVKLQRLQR